MDVLLLQDIVANQRTDVINGYYYNQNGEKTQLTPITKHFKNYTLLVQHTECAILYRSDLEITELEKFNVKSQNRNDCTVICGILLHTKKHSIGIY